MTSMSAESVSTIKVSCRQTRFHIESPNYRELDVEGLTVTLTSGDKAAGGSKAKGKGKARAEGLEILADATLRLKAGQRYALIGRNGAGKSTLLRAISEKLIPGIPEKTRVSILQQTNASEVDTDEPSAAAAAPQGTGGLVSARPVLEEVIEKAISRHELERDINALQAGIDSSEGLAALRALRRIKHERLEKELFVRDKDARLRSGARGLKARQALVALEKTVADSKVSIEQDDEEISPETVHAETQEAADILAELQIQMEPSRVAEIESSARKILAGLGFSETYMSKPASSLSGGWLTRMKLAICLLQETDILILDEPTNFLDLLGIVWLQRHLAELEDSPSNPASSSGGAPTLILVTHDRDFSTLCTDLMILKDKTLTYFHGDLPSWESSTAERRTYLTKMKEAQDKQKAHMQKTIQQNMREGRKNDDENRVRQAKMRQRKLEERWGLEVSAKGGRFKLNRDHGGYHLTNRAEIEIPPEERGVHLELPAPSDLRFPGPLVSVEDVSFRYPAQRSSTATTKTAAQPPAVLQGINLSIHMGDRIGILGLNGAGKSTLIKLLVQEEKPTRGSVNTHPRLKLGYYSQHAVEALQLLGKGEEDLTALKLLLREAAGELDEGDVRGLLGSLGLPGRVASDVPLRKLSGGQLVRCELVRLLWRRPHCLVLDEVTTHLDYETVIALRLALRGWGGAVVLVSHDRWFLRGAVEGLIEEGEEGGGEGSDGDDGGGGGGNDAEGSGFGGGLRRRMVYRLAKGELTLLKGGVQEFEDIVEKRVRRLQLKGA